MASKTIFLFFLFENWFSIFFFNSKHMKTLAVVAGNVLSCCCYCIQAAAFDFYSELLPKVCWTIVVLQEAEKLLIVVVWAKGRLLLLFFYYCCCWDCFLAATRGCRCVWMLLKTLLAVFATVKGRKKVAFFSPNQLINMSSKSLV